MDSSTETSVDPQQENPREAFLKKVKQIYKKGQSAAVWEAENRLGIGRFIGNQVKHFELYKLSKTTPAMVLSVASNVGIMEQGMQEELGSAYTVISNDIVTTSRRPGTIPVMADGAHLPFKAESFVCIVDILGGLWHDLILDKKSRQDGTPSNFTAQILEEYKRKLKSGGMLIVDLGKASTGHFLDEMYNGSSIEGFNESEQADDVGFAIRMYRKL